MKHILWLSFPSLLVFCYKTINYVKHYLEDYRIGKITQNSISYTLGQKKRMIFWKNTKLAFESISRVVPRYWENHLTFLDGVFCDLLQRM